MKTNDASLNSPRPRLVDLFGDGPRLLQTLRGSRLLLPSATAEGFKMPTASPETSDTMEAPRSPERLLEEILALTARFHSAALSAGYSPDMVKDAIYAIYAAIDEAVLASPLPFRDAWQTRSLQLSEFGDQLAGEHFFQRLKDIRLRSTSHAEVAEIYHLCMALGFKGEHALGDDDKLRNLIVALGSDIAHARPVAGNLAHRGLKSDVRRFSLRYLVSKWIIGGILACGMILPAASFCLSIDRQGTPLAGRDDVIQIPTQVVRLKITLP